MLAPYGWTAPGSPVRIISFFLPGLERAAEVLPHLPRTLLIEKDLGEWRDGHLPEGIGAVGPDYLLLRDDPDFIARALDRGNEVHVWTVNRARDISWCLTRGVTGITTDDPAVAAAAVARWARRTATIA